MIVIINPDVETFWKGAYRIWRKLPVAILPTNFAYCMQVGCLQGHTNKLIASLKDVGCLQGHTNTLKAKFTFRHGNYSLATVVGQLLLKQLISGCGPTYGTQWYNNVSFLIFLRLDRLIVRARSTVSTGSRVHSLVLAYIHMLYVRKKNNDVRSSSGVFYKARTNDKIVPSVKQFPCRRRPDSIFIR